MEELLGRFELKAGELFFPSWVSGRLGGRAKLLSGIGRLDISLSTDPVLSTDSISTAIWNQNDNEFHNKSKYLKQYLECFSMIIDQLDKFGLNYSTREEENHLFLCLCDGNRIQVDMAVAQLLSPLPIQVTHIPLEIIGKWNLR